MTSDSSKPAAIEMRGVRKQFGDQSVLSDVDLSVPAGQKMAIIGASGCGKTTLLRCVNALERIDAGTLIVNGEDLQNPALDVNRFRARIGMVFQQFNLFPHLNVLQNLMLGPVKVQRRDPGEVKPEALALLEKIGIPTKADAYPDRLSGGQKQRVAIARSLVMRPELLLLDEPTSALDPPMRHEVLDLIESVSHEGMTILMVTHELNFARRIADRLLVMDHGRIVEDGVPAEILSNPQNEVTRRYLKAFD